MAAADVEDLIKEIYAANDSTGDENDQIYFLLRIYFVLKAMRQTSRRAALTRLQE